MRFTGFNVDYSKLDPATANAIKQLILQSKDISRDLSEINRESLPKHSDLSGLDYAGSGHTGFMASGTSPTRYYAIFRDEKTAGTNGGTSTATSDHTRTLNASHYNNITGCSLASDQITLPAGTYLFNARSPCYAAYYSQLRLRNITDSTNAIIGDSHYIDLEGWVELVGIITITAQKVFSIIHYIHGGRSTTGLGFATNAGLTETYTTVVIEKIA